MEDHLLSVDITGVEPPVFEPEGRKYQDFVLRPEAFVWQ